MVFSEEEKQFLFAMVYANHSHMDFAHPPRNHYNAIDGIAAKFREKYGNADANNRQLIIAIERYH